MTLRIILLSLLLAAFAYFVLIVPRIEQHGPLIPRAGQHGDQ